MGEPIGIALLGAAGRMGREIAKAAKGRRDLQITQAVEHAESSFLGVDLGELDGEEKTGVVVSADLEAALNAANVAIDLSLPAATQEVIRAARATRTALVCGTTGLDENTLLAFDSAAADIPVLYTPNLSLGVAVTDALIRHAIEALGGGYDIEIVEMHHRDKVDAPSGTALKLAQTAADAAGIDPEKGLRHGRFGRTGVRPSAEVGVHAIRGGGVFGEHKVILAGKHDQIEIVHRASSRALFAEGALRVALFLHDKSPGRYSMADIFNQ